MDQGASAYAEAAAAWREIQITEGSDWYWWFSHRHDSGMDAFWDNEFRLHLRNAYKVGGVKPPTRLFQPIIKAAERIANVKYGKDSDLYGPYFYDSVKLYAEAIKRGRYTKEGIIKGLKEIKDFQGVVGKMGFDQGNVVLLPLRFVQFGNGKWNPIAK